MIAVNRPVLAHGQHRGQAAGYIEAGEDVGQLLMSRSGVDGITDGGGGNGDNQGCPPRHTWDIWVDRAVGRLPPPILPAVLTHVDRTGNGPKRP